MREGGPALSQRVASSYETATTQARSPSYRCFRGVDKPALWVQDRLTASASWSVATLLEMWVAIVLLCRVNRSVLALSAVAGTQVEQLGLAAAARAVCITAAKGRRLLGGCGVMGGRGVKGWQVVSVAILTVALAVAGCGNSTSGGDGEAQSATTAAPATPTTWKPGTSGSMEVAATVTGRKLVGVCTGRNADAPTVLLEVGMGAPRGSLQLVEQHLAPRTQVCSYDRAGKGSSDPASTPRPVSEVITDLDAFLTQAATQGAKPPYLLVGQSFGAEVVFLYAQAHPDQVAGFVSINPSPPYKTWLKRARTVQTEAEIQEFELPFPQGENDEGIDTTSDESMLTDPLPADLPYAVMFDEECEGLPPPLQNQKDCNRMLSLLELTAKDLAKVGKAGRYVRVKNAGHDIQVTDPDAVLATVEQIWKAALGR